MSSSPRCLFLDSLNTSCLDNHNQNSVVERKHGLHRHVTEVVLALLAPFSFPCKLWVEAFLFPNRPPQTLHLKSPHGRVFKSSWDYQGLKTFSCCCFPHKVLLCSDNKKFPCFTSSWCGFKFLEEICKAIFQIVSVDFHSNGNFLC